jgi:hypothetical protein
MLNIFECQKYTHSESSMSVVDPTDPAFHSTTYFMMLLSIQKK